MWTSKDVEVVKFFLIYCAVTLSGILIFTVSIAIGVAGINK